MRLGAKHLVALSTLLFAAGMSVSIFLFISTTASFRNAAQSDLTRLCSRKRTETEQELLGGGTVLTSLRTFAADRSLDVPQYAWSGEANQLLMSGGWQISTVSLLQFFDSSEDRERYVQAANITTRGPNEISDQQRLPGFSKSLIITNGFPNASSVAGFDYLRSRARTALFLESLSTPDKLTASDVFVSLDSQGVRTFSIVLLFPIVSQGRILGAISGFYSSEALIVNRNETQNILFKLDVDDQPFLEDEFYRSQNLFSQLNFIVYRKRFSFQCGTTFVMPVTPHIIVAMGILLSLSVPAITATHIRQVRLVKKETRGRVEAELAKDAARQAAEVKSAFLANMSHELRTPLNGIKGNSEFLLETKLDEEQIVYANTIHESAGLLMSIVNDVLDFSKIEQGKMVKEDLPTNMAEILRDLPQAFSKQIAENNTEMEVLCEIPENQYVLTDPYRLRQVINNIVSNAMKFTVHGNVTVRCWQDEGKVYVSVTDTGIGMTDEVLSRLFTPFTQADSSTARQFGGTGLGLSISKKMIELLRGDISGTSKEGVGSVFTIWIPRELAGAPPVPKPVEELRAPRPGIWILIVDDNSVNQKVAGHMVKKLGYECIFANNGREAVEMVLGPAGDKIQSLLLDLSMPVLDGYGATQEIRAAGKTVPIIAMTANAMHGEREKCLERGFDDYVTKPLVRATLANVLASWVDK